MMAGLGSSTRVSLPTDAEYTGPFLIEASQLFVLDAIINEYEGKFQAALDEYLDGLAEQEVQEAIGAGVEKNIAEVRRAEFKARLKQYRGKEKKSLIVYLTGGRTISSDTFRNLVKQPHMENEVALGFSYSLRAGNFESKVKLLKRYGDEELSIE